VVLSEIRVFGPSEKWVTVSSSAAAIILTRLMHWPMLDADPDKPNSVILIYSQRLEPADASVNTARSNKIYDNIAILGATTREVNRAL